MENFTMVVTPDVPTSEVLVDELRSIGGKSLLQYRQTIVASWISSAQYGYIFIYASPPFIRNYTNCKLQDW